MRNDESKKIVAGVDISSQELVVRWSVDSQLLRVENNTKAIRELLGNLERKGVTLVVCEHTGRHEWELLQALWKRGIPVHCAHPKAVRNFAKALSANAKSDPIDAEVILQYGLRMDLSPTEPPSPEFTALKALTSRREDLNRMLVDEKNRLTAPALPSGTKRSLREHIRYLQKMLKTLEVEMRTLVAQHQSLKAPIECLDEEHGVGFVSAATLYSSMPELGTLNKQTSAALAGVAPFIRSSGKFSGQRKIYGGRTAARCALYMVALTAIRNKTSPLRHFYLRLKAAGKHTSVAITAVMRKIIIRLNTRMKELRAQQKIAACC